MTSTTRTANEPTKRADQRASITVLVLGDEGVGKSSLISTFVSRYFSEVVQGIMTRVRLPPDPNSSCITTIVDSQGADSALLSAVAAMSLTGTSAAAAAKSSTDSFSNFMQRAEASRISTASTPHLGASTSSVSSAGVDNVDSIILVYDLDRVETFFRLENHWLPLIERCYNGEMPVIIAGNKMDLFRTSSTAGMTDEQAMARSRQQIVSLMQRFRFVRQCIKCSAKNLLRVDEIFLKAQQAVLYPFTPLYDLDNVALTPDCKRAFTRIFRMYDADKDGLLSDPELDQFHREAFQTPVMDRDFAAWKKVVTRNNQTDEPVVKDNKFTIAGFLAIFDVFISQNRLDVVWQALRKFGYDDDLRLEIPDSVTNTAHDKGLDENWRLTPAARTFLSDLFHQFDSDKDGMLSGDDLLAIFSILPEPSLPPWHPLRASEVFKDCRAIPKIPVAGSRSESYTGGEAGIRESVALAMSQSLSASGITILSSDSVPTVNMENIHNLAAPLSFLDWMGFWHSISSVSPAVARAELFRLGHVEKRSKKHSKRSGRRKKGVAPITHTPDSSLLSRELRVLVLGSATSGRTDLVEALCGLDGSEFSTFRGLAVPGATNYPESSSAHVKVRRKISAAKVSKDIGGDEFVVHLVFTEFPQLNPENRSEQREIQHYIGEVGNRRCDLVMLVFDSSDDSSFSRVKAIEAAMLDDDLPRVFVATQKGTEDSTNDDDSVQPATVLDMATIHCRERDLEPPILTSLGARDPSREDVHTHERKDVLEHLARCARLNEIGVEALRSKPLEEQKRRDASRRRKLLWFGGLVSVTVVVAAGVGLLLGTTSATGKGDKKKDPLGIGWISKILFGPTESAAPK
ncbi:Mitochondrial Rho GTPase 2 [Seminavis robusta]|uniref:Mitochondrial Rho GTPase 2 n=1 Tax=Seminavis robusta TaxID=568900 RepID=A0A9N8HLY1_9STRA|nr:Mitochondrial Rho GTPase 2 [Seminavis robusta]|eukprot:Sro852_g210990.1 Mitochondrial Rho GTPase 2 (857) ;mRNA; r:17377-20460